MLPESEAITLLGVLEFDGLIRVEPNAVHTTSRFQRSMADARKKRRSPHPDLRASIRDAMRGLYGKYLSDDEVQSLVDAMLPIAAKERER